jgi:hypothetical protein
MVLSFSWCIKFKVITLLNTPTGGRFTQNYLHPQILQSKFEAEYEAAEDMQPYFSGIRLLASEITC